MYHNVPNSIETQCTRKSPLGYLSNVTIVEAGHEENYTETSVVKLNNKKLTWAEAHDKCLENKMWLLTVKNTRKADELIAKTYLQPLTVSVEDVGEKNQMQILTDTDSQEDTQGML